LASNSKSKKKKRHKQRALKQRALEKEERRKKRNRPLFKMGDVDRNDYMVQLKKSGVGFNSGNGLYAKRHFYAGDFITEYIGQLVLKEESEYFDSNYRISVGKSMVLVGDGSDRSIRNLAVSDRT
jgi:hypothetical protein